GRRRSHGATGDRAGHAPYPATMLEYLPAIPVTKDDRRIPGHQRHLRRETIGLPPVVTTEDRDEITGGRPQRLVEGLDDASRTDSVSVVDQPDAVIAPREAGAHMRRPVGRCVVDDDVLP